MSELMSKLEVNEGLGERIHVFKVSNSTVRTTLKLRKTRIFPFMSYFTHDAIEISHLVTLPHVAVGEVGLQMGSCELNKHSRTAG